jgi:branched-chain amino acid transport system substrate-binding protein
MTRKALLLLLGLFAPGLLHATPARADITIGALLSLTGPAAGLGIPARNTIELLPKTIAGEAVKWVVLDDASDTTAAVRAARKMIDEEHVDVILGPSNTPNSIAILDVAMSSGTPFLSLSGSNAVIDPPEGARRWAFKMFPSERLSNDQMLDHMKRSGVTTLGMIGFANALGDSIMGSMKAEAEKHGVSVVAETRYNPTDTSVTAQVLRITQAKPGAVFVVGSSTPATTPIIELRNRGYAGQLYTIMGIAGPDAIRVGGKALDGVMLSGVPVLVAEQLAEGNPVKSAAMRFITAYETKYGAGSRNLFGATMWDAFYLVDAATKSAMAHGKPGTPEFRSALRDGMEQVKGMPGAQGLFSLTPQDHSGAEPDSEVLIEIRGGTYHLVKP